MAGHVGPRDTELGRRLEATLRRSPLVAEVLRRAPLLQLPNWYLGAGCIAQTVWNDLHGFPLAAHIKDYDLVYFDSSDLSERAETLRANDAARLFEALPIELDVTNEARVHRWYPDRFGYAIEPYSSAEDGIASWPSTATAVGVRTETDGTLTTYAPFGLEDLFRLVVRPNRRQVTPEIYRAKVERWTAHWPRLRVIAWDAAPE